MVKKSAISGDYVINILDSGTVEVLKKCADSVGSVSGTTDAQNYSPCTNTMGVLREIAASVGFTINEKSNTRSNGAKLVDFINAYAPSAAKEATEPQSAGEDVALDAVPEPCELESVSEEAVTEPAKDEDVAESVIKSAESDIAIESSTLTNQSNEEYTEEEMAIIDELLKRIETLEARVEILERSTTDSPLQAETTNPNTLRIVKTYNYLSLNSGETFILAKQGLLPMRAGVNKRPRYVLNDGRCIRLEPIRTAERNYTVGQTRKVADMFGYKYDSKTKREALGWELVSKFGNGEYAIIGNKAVDADGVTYEVYFFNKCLYDPDVLAFLCNQKAFDFRINGETVQKKFEDMYIGDPFSLDPSWTEEEIHKNLEQFTDKLVKK